MFVGREFDVADPGENQVYGFDFVNDLNPGDTIVSQNSYLTVQTGIDSNPSSHLQGNPVLFTPTIVIQRIFDLLPGVTYDFQVVVTTQDGDVLSLYSRIPGRPVY